jgi:hypothetical protein
MSFSELLDAARKLTRDEKIRLVRVIMDEVAHSPEEEWAAAHGIKPGTSFDVWFPEPNGPAVAAALQALLDSREGR